MTEVYLLASSISFSIKNFDLNSYYHSGSNADLPHWGILPDILLNVFICKLYCYLGLTSL